MSRSFLELKGELRVIEDNSDNPTSDDFLDRRIREDAHYKENGAVERKWSCWQILSMRSMKTSANSTIRFLPARWMFLTVSAQMSSLALRNWRQSMGWIEGISDRILPPNLDSSPGSEKNATPR